MNEDSQIY